MQLVPESQDAMGGPTFTECRARLLARFGHRDEAIAALRHLLDIPYIGVTSLGALTPADLRLLPENKLRQLADELRAETIVAVSVTGGHLGGTPTVAGRFTFTIKVTDSAGDQASEPGSITISP